METFGEWLQQQRSLRRLTREEFAKRVGCSVSTLQKIEIGERRPSEQIAELMANCLDVPPEGRSTFVRVARGELKVDRLHPEATPFSSTSISSPKTNLPLFPTSLIGRVREVEQLSPLLHDPQCRLLTLVGPGGIGKTRLAIETASHMQDFFANGVFFVSLASVNTTSFLVPMIADALGFTFQSASRTDPKMQLFGYLKEKQILLLTDNLEHLLSGPGIEVLSELLANASQVKLLATSRESLGLQEEWVFEVPGLPVPEGTYMQGAVQNTSIELFLQRACRANVGFNATPEDYPAIIRICRLVEGNPLGIELAAAWVRTLSCGEIAREIARGLDILSISARDVPARHRSMRAVFDHSWKLLTEEEKKVMARLSVFRGGFQREAGEQVAGATLAVLSTLVTKSLIRRTGARHYDLHELVRQYAASKLAENPQELESAQERHSLYYLGLLEDQGKRLQSHEQKEAATELIGHIDNIRAAWDWSIATHEFIRLYQVSARLMHLFEVKNWFQEADITFRKTADALQASARGSELDADHQVALHAMLAHLGYFRFRLGEAEEACKILSPSAGFLRTSAGTFAAVYSHMYLGLDYWILGKFYEANESFQASRRLARECGERWHEAMDTEFLGMIEIEQGGYEEARQYLSEALTMLHQVGDPSMIAHALSNLGRTLRLLGEYREAKKILRESVELSREHGYHVATSLALDGLGELAYSEGHYEEAQTLFSESASLFQEMGDTHRVSRTLNHRGLNSMALGNTAGAKNDFHAALSMAYEGGWIPTVLSALTGLAALEIQREATLGILQLVQYVLQHPSSAQETKHLAKQLQLDVESKLSQEDIKAAHQRAQPKNLDEFVCRVLATFSP